MECKPRKNHTNKYSNVYKFTSKSKLKRKSVSNILIKWEWTSASYIFYILSSNGYSKLEHTYGVFFHAKDVVGMLCTPGTMCYCVNWKDCLKLILLYIL